MPQADRAGTFSGRVFALFGTSVFGAVIGIVSGTFLARVLGPAGKGDFYILTLLPATAMTFIQLGLSGSFTFFSARGETRGLVAKSLVLTVVLSCTALAVGIVAFPYVQEAFLKGIEPGLALMAFLALPLALNATFTTGIVLGRREVRAYTLVKTIVPLATATLYVIVVGALGASVSGAIAVYLVGMALQAIAFLGIAVRSGRSRSERASVGFRALFRYGLPIYPGTLTTFFSYRVDVYLIAFLLLDPSVSIGYYSLAVGLAELVFFFPNAVSQLFFPQVAGAPRDESDRQVATVSRVTLVITVAVAVLLIPSAGLMIALVLPEFAPSMAPLVVLLPGVVSLSVAKVLGGYIAGIGRPGINSAVSIVAFVVNIVANLLLIPMYGIVGAATASFVSYSVSALLMTAIVSRSTGSSLMSFWIPRASDVRFVVRTAVGILRRVLGQSTPVRPADGGEAA